MNNNQSENKEPDFFTPNAPIKYVMAGKAEEGYSNHIPNTAL